MQNLVSGINPLPYLNYLPFWPSRVERLSAESPVQRRGWSSWPPSAASAALPQRSLFGSGDPGTAAYPRPPQELGNCKNVRVEAHTRGRGQAPPTTLRSVLV